MANPPARSLYELPRYYDVVFAEEDDEDYQFLRECFEVFARRRVRRVYEPACGSGRLLAAMARDGLAVAGCDLSAPAVRYANARLRRIGHAASVVCADMSVHRPRLRVDAAFNLVSSIQLLRDDAGMVAHLQMVARSLARGGIYVFGLQLLPTQGPRMMAERWVGEDGGIRVATSLRSIALDRRARCETCRMTTRIAQRGKTMAIEETVQFRTYTRAQLRGLLRKVPEFEIVATYDFRYEIWNPIQVGPKDQDVIYVLRRV